MQKVKTDIVRLGLNHVLRMVSTVMSDYRCDLSIFTVILKKDDIGISESTHESYESPSESYESPLKSLSQSQHSSHNIHSDSWYQHDGQQRVYQSVVTRHMTIRFYSSGNDNESRESQFPQAVGPQ